jgi:hypothetical protein
MLEDNPNVCRGELALFNIQEWCHQGHNLVGQASNQVVNPMRMPHMTIISGHNEVPSRSCRAVARTGAYAAVVLPTASRNSASVSCIARNSRRAVMAVLGQFEDLLTIVQRVSSNIAPLDHCHAPNLNEGPVSGFRDDSFTL